MIINNTFRQKNLNFGATEQKTAQLVEKWTQKKRPDKLILMVTCDDFPGKLARQWADFKAYWLDKESRQTSFFRIFEKKYKYLGIGDCRIKTLTPVVRPELFQKALKSIGDLMQNSGAKARHQDKASKLYAKHSMPLDTYIPRNTPELDKIFDTFKRTLK